MGEGKPRAAPALARIAGGEMAKRVRAFDWSTTPLGPMDSWSPSLRLAVDMILATNFPMALRWGPELVLIYNDAYSPALHEHHPSSLGIQFRDTSADFQASIRTLHEEILSGESGGFAFEKLPLRVLRRDQQEMGWFTVSYSPVPDATAPNGVGGVLVTAVEITDTVKAAEDLRGAQERYQLAREAAGVVGAWEWDIKANKVYADARYAELHNIAPEFAEAGLPVQSYTPAVHPDDRERVSAVALASAQTGGDFSEEYRLIQPDGSVRWVYTRGRAYLDANGKPERNTGVIIDITERKQVEAALAAARVDVDIAAQAAGMGRWDHNPSMGQRYWDPRARTIFGIPQDVAPSTEVFERAVHPDDLPAVRAAIAAAMDPNGSGAMNMEYRVLRANGALRWVEVFGRAFFEGESCVRFVGVVSDVTERREAIDRLLRQEETLRLAIDAADVGTWDFNVETGELIWSERCYGMFGLPRGEPVDPESSFAHVHPSDAPRVREAIARAMDPAIRADYVAEFRVIGRDDHVERWLSVKGKAFFDNAGKARRFVGAAVNITDRKRSELHLRLLVNEMNHRVKNSLATIQAIAAQSFNGARPLPQAQEAFSNRIVALAEAHDLLTRENWEGADLHEVAERLAALHGGPARFELSGPAVRLSPKTALSLSMALHELATNAIKYGALSTAAGRVRVAWDFAPDSGGERLDLTWTERDGPPVKPPTQRGFGSRLIEKGLAAELSGSAAIDFLPDGVVCRIQALLEA
ncbi:sensor histidine kinase [Caulobacter sp.]|uniref:sensor histidine kinase n=1 Tax=Caulobacter sp. TaxID=78 RepID=UPI002B45D875|nr:PAS domain-containing protein [Caulobacter sp.]HJV43275.1 PAS domain-containing protein [Caulobacter sp.]